MSSTTKIHLNREITIGYHATQNRQKEEELVNVYLPDNSPKFAQNEKAKAESRGRYGLNGITSAGRRKIRNACTALQRKYGRSRLTFATVTLPRMSKEEHEILHKNWATFIRYWQKEIKREAARNGMPNLQIVTVTEIQEKRLARYDELYLHLHSVWLGRPKGSYRYYIDIPTARRIVLNILRGILAQAKPKMKYNEAVQPRSSVEAVEENTCTTDSEYEVSVNLKGVKKSAARYLGKYMSKGGESLKVAKEKGLEKLLPKQWWNMTRKLSKVCEDAIQKLDCTYANFIMDNYQELIEKGILEYFYLIEIEVEGAMRKVGGVGKLSWSGMKFFDLKQPKINL